MTNEGFKGTMEIVYHDVDHIKVPKRSHCNVLGYGYRIIITLRLQEYRMRVRRRRYLPKQQLKESYLWRLELLLVLQGE